MPKRTRRQQSNDRFRMLGFFGVLMFLVVGLVLIWNQMPDGRDKKPMPIVPITQPEEPVDQPVISEPPVSAPTSSQARAQPAGTICDETNSICVSDVYRDALLASPFTVTGTAIAFEQQFAWKLVDGKGQTIEQGSTMTSAPDAGIPGPFTIRAFMQDVPKTSTGTLVLFEFSAKDGEPIHVLNVPVRLSRESMTVKYYAPQDSEKWQTAAAEHVQVGGPAPEEVTPLKLVSATVAKSPLIVEATLRAMLATTTYGPPQASELKSFEVKNGTAYVVLAADGDGWAGVSAYYAAIDPLIEKTLKQFSTVRNVVRGRTSTQTAL